MTLGALTGTDSPELLFILDTGSSENMMTTKCLKNICPNYEALLVKYTGPSVLSCTKDTLDIRGVLHTQVCIGEYRFEDIF